MSRRTSLRMTVVLALGAYAPTVQAQQKIYWTEASTDKIARANLDGTGVEDLIVTGLDTPRGIGLDMVAGKV